MDGYCYWLVTLPITVGWLMLPTHFNLDSGITVLATISDSGQLILNVNLLILIWNTNEFHPISISNILVVLIVKALPTLLSLYIYRSYIPTKKTCCMQTEPFLFSTQKSRRGRKFSKTHLGLICLITQNLLGRDNFSSLVSLAINFSSEGGFLFAPQKTQSSWLELLWFLDNREKSLHK